jgi:hypothetical protein
MNRHFVLPALVGLTLATLVACDSTSPSEPSAPTTRRLLLIVPQATTLVGGRTLQLKVSVLEPDGQRTSPGTVLWFTTSSLVAGIASNGTVTARKNGTANIVAEWDGLRAVATVTVIKPVVDPGCPALDVRGGNGSTPEGCAR